MSIQFLQWRWVRRWLAMAFGIGLAITLINPPATSNSSTPTAVSISATPAQIHPLPQTLAAWQDATRSGDYFDQVKPVDVGYLVWSTFPVTVYVQPVTAEEARYPFLLRRTKDWESAVLQAVQEWNRYLPLTVVDQPENASITVWRSPPPLQLKRDGTGQPTNQGDRPSLLPIERVRSAETRFELYTKPEAQTDLQRRQTLAHRISVRLRPDQSPTYLLAAARHELGHALGIWGHSPRQTDALYFSQVRNPLPISPRDINTLKRVYEQPTRLGWAIDPSPQ